MFNIAGEAHVIDYVDITEMEAVMLDSEGSLKLVSKNVLVKFSKNHRQVFCVKYGLYSIPTVELVSFIDSLIDNKDKAIEIGSGCGIYARSLGIIGTDNFMQHPKNKAKFSGVYDGLIEAQQTPVQYGENVIEIDGQDAIKKNKSHTVVCSWVTHKFNRLKPELKGNMYGIDFSWILKRNHTKRIILIGNENTHKNNPIMAIPHETHVLNGSLFSRSYFDDLDRVYVWDC